MLRKQYPSQAEVKELLDYDPAIGIFVWRERTIDWFENDKNPSMSHITWNSQYAGQPAGSTDGNYIKIQIRQQNYMAHKLAWIYIYGDEYKGDIDHKNRNKKANWIDNLRPATFAQNIHNSCLLKNNTSGVKGVSWVTSKQRWEASIMIDYRGIYLGRFKEFIDAVRARYNAEVQYGFTEFNPESTAFKYLAVTQT